MVFDDTVADTETKSGPFASGFGAEKRITDFIQNVIRNAHSVVMKQCPDILTSIDVNELTRDG
jgi:hypothetical protein